MPNPANASRVRAIVPALLGAALLAGCGSEGGAPPEQAAIEAAANAWTYVPFPNTACGNGKSYGLAVNPNPASKKVMVFIDGGGWCWNKTSCTKGQYNITTYTFDGLGESDVKAQLASKGGVLDRTNAANPFRDYNLVYVPYCSGDMYIGTAGATDYGVVHKGAENMQAFLKRLVPTFEGAEQVVLAGDSAGGFGALLNFDAVQKAFGKVPVHLLSDSAPPLPGDYVPQDLLDRMWASWKPAWPAGCTGCRNFHDLLAHLSATYPASRFGFVASTDDWLLRRLWAMTPDGALPTASMPAELYYDGLVIGAKSFSGRPNVGWFVNKNDQHVYTDKAVLYLTKNTDGSTLPEWIGNLAAGARPLADTIDARPAGGGGGGPVVSTRTTPDAAGDEAYAYPTDPSYGRQQDIVSAALGQDGDSLRLTLKMAQVTDGWAPANGFDHVSFSIYFRPPGGAGLTALPEAEAEAPAGFGWTVFHRVFGWGSALYSSAGASATTRGTLLPGRPAISVDKAAGTITFDYRKEDLGFASWDGVRVYVTAFDIDGISDSYRNVSAAGGQWDYGRGSAGSPRIMDDLPPLDVPAGPTVLARPAGDVRYRYPTDASFANQNDIVGVSAASNGGSLSLKVRMAQITDGWAPANGFDHLSLTVFVQLPGDSATVAALPEMNATMPGGGGWSRMFRVFGWGNTAYRADGAGPDARGTALDQTARVTVDKAGGTITLDIDALLLGNLPSLSGARIYVASWDIDGISDAYRALSPEGGQWAYGGGAATAPKIMDDALLTLP